MHEQTNILINPLRNPGHDRLYMNNQLMILGVTHKEPSQIAQIQDQLNPLACGPKPQIPSYKVLLQTTLCGRTRGKGEKAKIWQITGTAQGWWQ